MRVTRSGFYAWLRRGLSARAQRDVVLRTKLRAFHAASGHRYGRPRLWKDLQEDGEAVSEKRVAAPDAGGAASRASVPKRFKHDDQQRSRPIRSPPNVLDRDFTAAAPNQRWVGDTTEFVIGEQRQAVSGGDSRSVFALRRRLGDQRRQRSTPHAEGARDGGRSVAAPSRGCCITRIVAAPTPARTTKRISPAHGITCSMSRRGDCYDNAVMESFFATVKKEEAERFPSYSDAKMALFDYIEVFYNQRRRHSTLGQISPAAFERRAAAA